MRNNMTTNTKHPSHTACADELEQWRKSNFGFLTPRQNDQLKAIVKSTR